jgi:hypothetical protein
MANAPVKPSDYRTVALDRLVGVPCHMQVLQVIGDDLDVDVVDGQSAHVQETEITIKVIAVRLERVVRDPAFGRKRLDPKFAELPISVHCPGVRLYLCTDLELC